MMSRRSNFCPGIRPSLLGATERTAGLSLVLLGNSSSAHLMRKVNKCEMRPGGSLPCHESGLDAGYHSSHEFIWDLPV